MSWVWWWDATCQAMALALYTAVLTPIGVRVLDPMQRWLVTAPSGRMRRTR